MSRVAGPENPFQPGAGARPPVLAGRDTELALADEMLDSLQRGRRPSRGLLLFGPRGNGKTVLLDRIAEHARGRGMRAVDLPASAFRSPEVLTQELQENAGLTGARLRGAHAAGFGVSTEPELPTRNAARLLASWVGEGHAPLVILLDEAHTVEPDAGRIFFEAVQEATKRSLLLLLLVAGTPDAPRRLRRTGTFTERALRRLPVGRLPRDETIRAFREPTSASGLPLDDDAAAFLAAESQDYPYFIQLLGSAVWRSASVAGASGITKESARKGTAAARPEIERFYAERFAEARDRGIHRALTPLAALASERGGRLGECELDGFLAGAAGATGEAELLNTLTDLGVLWRSGAAGWEMGIPSFTDHILALTADEPAPAIFPRRG